MNNRSITFYIENLSNVPWEQAASAKARHHFEVNVLGQLLRFKNGKLHSDFLERFEHNEESNTYIFTLKPNLYFHNGRSVHAKDLEFSLVRCFFASKPNEGSMENFDILGLDKINHGTPYASAIVRGIKILDELSLSVQLNEKNILFLNSLCQTSYSLVPQEELCEDLIEWNKWPIGVGDYKVIESDYENKIFTLELVNENLNNQPKIVYFSTKLTQNPDLSNANLNFANDPYYKIAELNCYTGKRLILFNFNHKFSKQYNFRRAIELALNKEDIAKETKRKSEELHEILLPKSIGRSENTVSQNIEKGKMLLEMCLDADERNKTYKIPISADSYLGNNYKLTIEKQLQDIGLKVEFVESDKLWHVFYDEFTDSPFRLCSQIADNDNPILNFSYFRSASAQFYQHPNDISYDKLYCKTQRSKSTEELIQRLKELSENISDSTVAIPLFCFKEKISYNSQKIQEISPEQMEQNILHFSNIVMKT
ncbi:ABC transporter substrate-binding protein [Fluviispira vulneris]|uniref:ABC transporter substrate-binding protein n=1 Tax=Fluviispira vulneris TaxID=2763012 RepID=UPI00164612D1|nr:ABC transporter substrate-binding protein [Fluviispira vulneris]